ncbi:MAG: GAF domain-containing protein [Candidatus Omnitrophica bacterium]|nr:GAF domain-containing protein [Candidatus Omnitrophota bacterium]
MHWIIPAISIDCGFKFAVSLILFLRYFDTKDKVIFWWAMGWLFFGLHTATELTIIGTEYEPLWFIRHIFYAFPAVAFLESVGNMQRLRLKIWHIAAIAVGLGTIISSYIGVFVVRQWYAATIPISFLNGLGFIVCAFYFLKITKEKKNVARLLIFLGFLLNGIHNLDYPFLRPIAWFAPIGFSLGVVFSVIFAIGLIITSTEELKRQREKSQKIARDFSAVNTIATIVNQSLNLEEILKDVLDKVISLIKVGMAGILLLDEKNKCLNLTVYKGISEDFAQAVKNARLDKKTFTGQIVQAGKITYVADITKESTVLNKALKKEGIRSFVGIPLKSKDKILGLMTLGFRNYRTFSQEEFQLLTSIGSTIGVAVENANLYEKVKNWNKKLEEVIVLRTKDLTNARKATLNMLEDINEAYRELKETQTQLIQKERLAAIGQMAAVISHELRNPLTNLKISAYYLYTKLAKSAPELTTIIRDLENEVERASCVSTNILEFSRPPKLIFNLADINEVIKRAIYSAEKKSLLKNIETIEKLDPAIHKILFDDVHFEQALENIILNASQAMPHGGKLTIQSSVANNELEIRITDTGIGIAEENLEKIFEPFFTDKHKGIGLGLVVANEIIKKHQGSITVESKVSEGSVFIVRIPLKKS